MPPKVSVIIANYNYGAYLEEALHSVLSQTLQDFEVIIVDDGSTDNSRAVIERLAPGFGGRLKAIYQKNCGVAAARNTALAEARGEFLGFLDADDVWSETCLEDLLYFLEYYPEEMGVYGNAEIFESESRRTVDEWFSKRYFRRPFSGLCADKLFLRGNFIPIVTAVVRRRALEKVGVFEEHLRVGEDLDFWLRFTGIYAMTYFEKIVCRVRRHQGNLSFIPLNAYLHGRILRKALRNNPGLRNAISGEEFARRWHGVYYDIGRNLILEGKPRRGNLFLRGAWSRHPDIRHSKILFYFLLSYWPWKGTVVWLRKLWRFLWRDRNR